MEWGCASLRRVRGSGAEKARERRGCNRVFMSVNMTQINPCNAYTGWLRAVENTRW